MDLSDDSFAWSNASNDSSDMAFDIKQEEHGDDSDGNYKRKVKEKLSTNVQEHKKAKKRKHEEPAEVNGDEEEKPKRIKLEPDSDFEIPKKKKKKKRNKDIPNSQDTQESTDYDDSYLNYRVKQEQMTFTEPAQVKPKKKKKHNTSQESESVICEEITIEQHDIDTDMTVEENHIEENSVEENLNVKQEVEIKKKKKKSKHDTHTSNDDFETSDDNFKAKKKLKSKKQDKINKSQSFDKSNTSQNEEISCIDSSTVVNHYLEDEVKDKSDDDVNNESIEPELNSRQATSNSKPSKKTPQISDRLRFEDEDSIEFNPEENFDDTNLSKQIKHYLNNHKDLSLIKSKPQSESILTEDDEIWILKVPYEISIKDFKDINMKLDTKSKLKFNGQTYDSVSDNSVQKVPVFSYRKNKTYIQDISVMGLINLRKRVPKAHIPEENVLINHQLTFIPLPETKCRHPLFGINYKKATKISSSVAERLNNAVVSPAVNGEREKRKKHKKEKRKMEVETESETKPLDELTPEVTSKKKRKRKSSIKEEPVSKKAKYVKDEPESGDVWESEQAIEKNLFDF